MRVSVDQLKERALALDSAGLVEALGALDEDERAEAREWVLRDRTFFDEVRRAEPDFNDKARYGAAPWMRVLCVVALCPPAEAARAVRWGDIWDHMTPDAREHTAQLVAAQPRDWAETFLVTTAGLRLSRSDADHAGYCLAWLVDRGLADHDLPCPDGAVFLQHHLRDGWRVPVDAARLRADRLMPDLVHLMIERGFAGNLSALHEAVPELVADGILDRTRLVRSCLEALTAETRVGSQRVVAKVLAALDLRADEVPGGLAYLTGVIATGDGSVGSVLLPRALALTQDAAGLEELTRVIAGRKERKQKQVLLAFLRDPATSGRAGLDAVLASLEVLAVGQEDSALLHGVAAARAELGAPVDPEEHGHEVVGLWLLDLDPGPVLTWRDWMDRERFGWHRHLDRRTEPYAAASEFTVDTFVRDLAAHGPDHLVALCHRLRVDGNLALTRLPDLVEPAFLAGGLRILWPAVISIADDVASGGRLIPGLAELLRLLTRYAAEVPDGVTLPSQLARLASGGGSTKTQLEARALGAALARVADDAFETPDPAASPRTTRGLWDLRPRVPVLARLLEPYHPYYNRLRDSDLPYLLALGDGIDERTHMEFGQVLVMDVHLVRELASEAQWSGVDDVRRRVAAAPRLPGSDRGPTSRAIRAWDQGELTTASYWDVLAADRTTGPSLDHVVFAWTCEQLVRLETHPGLLSGTHSTSGSVVPARLAEVVRSFAGIATVGPLDLLLTLTRLRVEATEHDRAALDSLDGLELWTDPAVTPHGSFDVVPIITGQIEDPGRPLDLARFGGVTEDDLRGPASHHEVRRRVWPRDPSLAQPERDSTHSGNAPWVLEDGRLPTKAWQKLFGDTFSDNAVVRERALTHIVELSAYDGVLDPSVTLPTVLAWFDGGHLPLGRFADALQWLFERGGLRQLWPLGPGVAAAAVQRSPKPSGLPFLLSSLATYAPEVPPDHRTIPAEIAALAASTGRTKGHSAARDLVAALEHGERVLS